MKKLSSIEDYVSIQTAPIETNTRLDEDIDVERDINMHNDPLYTETGVPKEESILAITDDPSRIMAIDEGETILKLTGPSIREMDTNLNQSMTVEVDQNDENTFITNMIDDSYQAKQEPMLPVINKYQNRQSMPQMRQVMVSNDSDKVLKVQDESLVAYNNEYQLRPINN